ncbi:ribosome biogenesis GTP-binding protein YihA/YsxC [uncultured Paraglaciecola sp.]|uniref:ribosome biogenesis GTP-binding protein YihA/YsxC n=1 Tax=uncultured Paraglaciecola sp. TaxID=1765024 RepID=UPI0025D7856E|nr:ribosome biogenesis GTP-binding protein YihA/YsxC [uncultured Paraglaciecola sp.]
MSQIYRQAHYTISATQLSELPIDRGIEVAFAGRSNAGKSSAINTIADQKSLARISKTPGRTQMINFFAMDDDRALVDLPGYGYAKVPEQMKIRWQQTLGKYLETRQSLRGLMLMMDIRHPLKEFDLQMIKWANNAELEVHILLTKSDKLKHGAAMATLHQVKAKLKEQNLKSGVQLFSSLKKSGKEEAIEQLDRWFIPDESISATSKETEQTE